MRAVPEEGGREKEGGAPILRVLAAIALLLAALIAAGTVYALAAGTRQAKAAREAAEASAALDRSLGETAPIGAVTAPAGAAAASPGARSGAGRPESLPEGVAAFTDIGTIRATTRGPKPAIVIATPSFPYRAGDRDFREELFRKGPALRSAAIAWFSARSAEELHPSNEAAIKAGLRASFNALLSLGKVEEIWLSDLAVIR